MLQVYGSSPNVSVGWCALCLALRVYARWRMCGGLARDDARPRTIGAWAAGVPQRVHRRVAVSSRRSSRSEKPGTNRPAPAPHGSTRRAHPRRRSRGAACRPVRVAAAGPEPRSAGPYGRRRGGRGRARAGGARGGARSRGPTRGSRHGARATALATARGRRGPDRHGRRIAAAPPLFFARAGRRRPAGGGAFGAGASSGPA